MTNPAIRAGKEVEWVEGMTDEQHLAAIRHAEHAAEERYLREPS